FLSSRSRHTSFSRDWSSDVCSSDLTTLQETLVAWLRGKSIGEKILLATMFIGVGNALLIPINLLLFLTAFLIPGWAAFTAGLLRSEERRVAKDDCHSKSIANRYITM